MKIISFFLCCLFLSSPFDAKASVSEDLKIYHLDVQENNKKLKIVNIIDRDERTTLEKTNINEFEKLMRIPVVLTANKKYQIGERALEENDQITVSYHFNDYKMIKTLNRKTPMNLPKEFKPMTEWQAVVAFANALLGEIRFTIDDLVEDVIVFMNNSDREHHKKQYLENWVEKLFRRKIS